MKKALKISLKIIVAILVVAILGASVLVATNFELAKGAVDLLLTAPGNNLKAAWIFLTNNSQAISEKISQNDESYNNAVTDVFEKLQDDGISMSKEVLDALSSGEFNEAEMTRIIAYGEKEIEIIRKEKQAQSSAASNEKTQPDTKSEQQNEVKAPVADKQQTDNSSENSTTTQNTPSSNKQPESDNASTTQKPSEQTPPADTSADKPQNGDSSKVDADKENKDDTKNAQTSPSEQEKAPDNTSTEAVAPQPSADDTAATIAKLYVLKSDFVSQLTSIEKQIRDEYVSLPKEQQIPTSRKAIAGRYIKQVASMELECDKAVDSLLNELKQKLEASGKDTTVVKSLKDAYENEKSLKKAYYIDVYMNGI